MTSRQACSLLDKLFADKPGEKYYLELCLAADVRLNQKPFLWPWASQKIGFYQRWLLEFQEQLLRHMDWERYVEADYRRLLVDVRDTVQALSRGAK